MTGDARQSQSQSPSTSRCPVCQAGFRGTTECSRCGADLTPLMTLVVRGHRLREEARRLLLAGRFEAAREQAARAQQLIATRTGARQLALADWLARQGTGP